MLATYHNHSIYSDGKEAPSQIAETAMRFGIDELGLSDHFVLHPLGNPPDWAMMPEALEAYINELLQLREYMKERNGPMIRIGLEVDWFPGHAGPLRELLDPLPLDYVIGSVHFTGNFTIDGSAARWATLSDDERNDIHLEYWRRMKSLAESSVFDIVAHIDLTKKFGFYPTHAVESEVNDLIDDALDAIAAQKSLVVEVNTAGWYKPCADAYPSEAIVAKCKARNIPMTISADAHRSDHLLRDFDKAAERLRAAGYTEIARFANRQMRIEPLADAIPSL